MMFADGGQMLLEYVTLASRLDLDYSGSSGNFADELGEDFLGLRDLGIDKEHSLASLTVPSSVFYGRRKRVADAAQLGYAILAPTIKHGSDIAPVPRSKNPITDRLHLSFLLTRQHSSPTFLLFSTPSMPHVSIPVSPSPRTTRSTPHIARLGHLARSWSGTSLAWERRKRKR